MNIRTRYISCLLLLAACLSGCSKLLEDRYVDPDKTTTPTIEKLFSSMQDNSRIRPDYWDMRTLQFQHTGVYSQNVFFVNTNSVYQQNFSYTQDRWNDFYTPGTSGPIAHYRTMQRLYNELPVEDRANVDVFMQAGKVVLLDQMSQMIDMFGDLPYSEAGSMAFDNKTIGNARFEDQKQLYDTVLIGLKNASEYFAATTLNSVAAASFVKQDLLLRGSIDKWRRYINSLRLRLLMRISFVDEARARAEVQDIFANPIQLPLGDGSGVADYNPAAVDVLLHPLLTYTNNLGTAFNELPSYSAPDLMLNKVMKPANDPRIPIYFDKFGTVVAGKFVPNTEYKAMPVNYLESAQRDSITYFSVVDSSTFWFNGKLPGIVMTAAEVNFLKAEAYERWGGGSAQAAYELAVRQSIAFNYYLYTLNPAPTEALSRPSTTVNDIFLAQPAIAYTGTQEERLGKIWTQKWLHFGFLQTVQSWSETRRTKYPQLTFKPSTLPGFEMPPTRFQYPGNEIAYNPSYEAVREKDKRDVKIFWDVK